MRYLACLTFLISSSAFCRAAETWPLWDGKESVEDYAARVKLQPKLTLYCGDNVQLEAVLIPAGKFLMGTPTPAQAERQSAFGQIVMASGIVAFFALLFVALWQSANRRARAQFSLRLLMGLSLAVSVAVYGGVEWHKSDKSIRNFDLLTETREPDEQPAHTVTISKPFYMAKHETTQEQYQLIMSADPSVFRGVNRPVDSIAWDGAGNFCEKLRARTGRNVRLPTEAEWEYACRAGTATLYSSGDDDVSLMNAAWFFSNSKRMTHSVGEKAPNRFGLYDMHGNVAEWCSDSYDGGYYLKSAKFNPKGPREESNSHSARGGGYRDGSSQSRSSFRAGSAGKCGLRVVVSLAPKAK